MEDVTIEADRRPIYIGVIAALGIVVVIFLISIPSTKKKYSSTTVTTTPGVYQRPVLRPLSSFISENNQVVRFRSTATGEYYKTDYNLLTLVEGYNLNPILTSAAVLNSIRQGELLLFNLFSSTSPHFQNTPYTPSFVEPLVSSNFTNFIMQKYRTPIRPNDLNQEQYNSLLRDGWYIVPAYTIPENTTGLPFYLKPYLFGLDLLYCLFINKQMPPGSTIEENTIIHNQFIFDIDMVDQTAIDTAFNYRNVFRFVRSFNTDNAFYVENVLNPGVSFEVTRHNLMHTSVPMSEAFIDNTGRYRHAGQSVELIENTWSVPLVAREVTNRNAISFYIETSSL